MLAGVLALSAQSAGAKTLEEVLKEKGVITEADYNEIIKTAPKSKPVDYKLGQGFTFTSPDEKFLLSLGGQMQFRYTFNELDGPSIGPYVTANSLSDTIVRGQTQLRVHPVHNPCGPPSWGAFVPPLFSSHGSTVASNWYDQSQRYCVKDNNEKLAQKYS